MLFSNTLSLMLVPLVQIAQIITRKLTRTKKMLHGYNCMINNVSSVLNLTSYLITVPHSLLKDHNT